MVSDLYRLCFFLMLIFPAATLFAQEEDVQLRTLREELAEQGNEEEDLSELTDQLNFFRNHPIDLNHTNAEQLKKLVYLSALQISNLLNHLATNGKLLDLAELQSINGFDMESIGKLLPFVTLTPASPYKGISIKSLYQLGTHDLILRYGRLLQQQKGFRPLAGSRYMGSADKLFLRYKYQYDEILSASLLLKKDAGETFLNGKPAIDFLSGNLSFFKSGSIRKLVIGDYSLQFGQGLTLWSGFSFGKGPDVTSVASRDLGLKPYTSSNESAFFRGIASTIQLKGPIFLSPFFSFRKRDASLKEMPDGTFSLSTIGQSGLHRSQTELKNRKVLSQQVYGAAIQYLSNQFNIGIVGYHSKYEHTFVTGTQLYKRYAFTGSELSNLGLHYNYTFQNIYFYGETAKSIAGGWAIINGAMASISPELSAVFVHRNYDRNYHNFFSQSIGESSGTVNERGWYFGLNYTVRKYWKLSAYLDLFQFPWLKYRVDAPSSGFEVLTQLTYSPAKTFKITGRMKMEQKQQNADAGSKIITLQDLSKLNYRLEYNWKFHRKFSVQQRIEAVQYKKGDKETGYLFCQDLAYTPLSSKWSGNVRLAYFNTPTYNSRIYIYEDDILYSSSSGVYYGTGIRTFLNLRYRLWRKLDLWGRYAAYVYEGQESIGSGLDEISGNLKSDVRFQVRYQF